MTRIGRQTPTQSVIVPYTNTKGREALNLYKMIGRAPMDWEALLLYDMMALKDDGLWTHTKYGYSVPRRNGKTEILKIRELWGLINGEHIMHTAHRVTTEHASWEQLLSWVKKLGLYYYSVKAKGQEIIELNETGGRVEYRTRTSKGGLGEGFDLLVIDEAQEYTNDQESSLKYIVSDSQNPQTIMCGTPPTPVSSGTVFSDFRKMTLQGKTENSGWEEWSVSEQTDPHDIEAWYETNPSLGTVLTERSVADEIGSDSVDFNIQRLGLWIRYNQKSAISKTEWLDLKVDVLPKLCGKLFVGIKYGHDGSNVSMSIAIKTDSDKIFVEAIDCRPIRAGNAWIIDFLQAVDCEQIVIDGANGQQLLVKDLKDANVKRKLLLPTVKEIIIANASFEQGVFSKSICHKAQPSLVQAVSNCDKRSIGSNGGFGYLSLKDGADISLLDSIILAYWACSQSKEAKPQIISY